MSDLPPRLMQIIYDELNRAIVDVVDRLESLSRELPPAGEQFRKEVGESITSLTAATQQVSYYLAHVEKNLGKSIAEEFGRSAKRAVYDFKLEATNYTASGLPQAVAKELGPQLAKASADGLEALKAAESQLSGARQDVSYKSRGTMVMILAASIISLFIGFGLARLVYAPPDIGKADQATVLRDGLFLEELWPRLAPTVQRKLVEIHDTAESAKSN